jgi:tRNA dimethylallyltransferase
MTKTLIVILGPTGIGKTDLSIDIAKYYNAEIVSSDSRQIYKELKIGTAVPSELQLSIVKHHFISNKSIYDYYNASMFEFEVIDLLNKLFIDHDEVIMTGGSGLYINAVCDGIDELPTIDEQLREDLRKKFNTEGIESLRKQLKLLDPEYYKSVDLKNPKRLLKALEVSLMTGKPYSSLLSKTKKKRDFSIVKIGLMRDRDQLYERINKRVDIMVNDGLVEEAKMYFKDRDLNSLNTVGYKELFQYFDGSICLDKAIELIKRNSRRYAKRQISWFKRDSEINWFHPDEKE